MGTHLEILFLTTAAREVLLRVVLARAICDVEEVRCQISVQFNGLLPAGRDGLRLSFIKAKGLLVQRLSLNQGE